MKTYKVDLHITGTLIEEETQVKKEPITEKQMYYLKTNTNLPEAVINGFALLGAQRLIAALETAKKNTEPIKETTPPVEQPKQQEIELGQGAVMEAMAGKSSDGTCKITDCPKKATTKGFCNKHYQRWHKTEKRMRRA